MCLKLKVKIPICGGGYCIIDGHKKPIYRGWAQISLTNEAVKYILDVVKRNPQLLKRFSRIYAPDESFFHTIVLNSLFAENAEIIEESKKSIPNMLNLTYFEYPDEIRVFKNHIEYAELKETKCLFFRKVTTKESQDLLNYIDMIHSKMEIN